MSPSLAADGLTVARGGRVLAEGLSFHVPAGGAMHVTGPNGAGKSSLLRVLAGLTPPAAGTIARPDRTALLSEQAALDADRTLHAALTFWAAIDGAIRTARDVEAALDDVALADLGDVPVRLLSTGQRRRAALARVIASRATLWLLDEPANGLDAAAVARLERLVARHRAAGGIVAIATHQPLDLPDAVGVPL